MAAPSLFSPPTDPLFPNNCSGDICLTDGDPNGLGPKGGGGGGQKKQRDGHEKEAYRWHEGEYNIPGVGQWEVGDH